MAIKRLFTVIDLMLITLALYLCINGIYSYLSQELYILPPAATVHMAATAAAKTNFPPFSDYAVVSQRNLFHTTTDTKEPASDIHVDSLAQTRLKLKLWGTVVGDPDDAFAVIEDETQRQQKLYKIGDTVQNATVKMILRNKVVLSVEGRDEVLEMENRTKTLSASRFTGFSSAATNIARTRGVSRRRISLSRTQVDNAMSNLNELMGQINIQPHSENGSPDGMLLSNIKPNSIFRRMGLRNGDVLTTVDGQTIRSVGDALKLYDGLKTANATSIEIKRRGRPTIIEYRIR